MEKTLPFKIESIRRLCIKKDLIELGQWIDTLSMVNSELDQLKLIERQLLKISSIELNLQGVRRKNTLVMGMLCKYEQTLKAELEYGKNEYDAIRAKEHEKKREVHAGLISEFNALKRLIYRHLSKYQRR